MGRDFCRVRVLVFVLGFVLLKQHEMLEACVCRLMVSESSLCLRALFRQFLSDKLSSPKLPFSWSLAVC